MKTLYIKPITEELRELLAEDILNTSEDAVIEGYEEGKEFTW